MMMTIIMAIWVTAVLTMLVMPMLTMLTMVMLALVGDGDAGNVTVNKVLVLAHDADGVLLIAL